MAQHFHFRIAWKVAVVYWLVRVAEVDRITGHPLAIGGGLQFGLLSIQSLIGLRVGL